MTTRPAPPIIFMLDEGFQQRFYQRPGTAAEGVHDYLDGSARLSAYRLIPADDPGFAAAVAAVRVSQAQAHREAAAVGGYSGNPADLAAFDAASRQWRTRGIARLRAILTVIR